ncbi:Catechol-2,3-dioxygenase [Halogranum amylolyticum]|uniref:Catechol-2,3-dioxygenase n=1 Tax=Halogranum amylolyticum TaxID=660520 RepID=A0A1H8SSZ4_9EURY|nr:VOC family protein [Halogranum amylolyticum]SEO81880.1 Catechol-2,3-dioxygenase [Halogranum amylolyticum]
MLTALDRLGLEVKYLDRARAFYEDRLGLDPVDVSETAVTYTVGETSLVLRRPSGVPRGGLHTHFAFTTPADEYDDWLADFADLDPEEYTFGTYRSLYVDDPDDHCVEIGGIDDADGGNADANGTEGANGVDGSGLTGIFEVVLEVEELARAEAFYLALGFDVVDRGDERRRVRLRGPFDLELWEPQLGLADARGGVHLDLELAVADPDVAVEAVDEWVSDPVVVDSDDGVRRLRVRDPDCHLLTFTGR